MSFSHIQIIIPMSGFGERFRKVGYDVPKPLIEVEGKPIIAHLIDLFPGEERFLFICNQAHLDHPDYHMEVILKKYCPKGKIVGIAPHKLGPIHTVLEAMKWIDLELPALVNYCDFTCRWDWNDFVQFTKTTQCTGAIPAYRGFHPHSLGPNNYAYIKDEQGKVLDIQEKQPYTDNRMQEFASSGTYYFSSGQLMLDIFRETMKNPDLKVNNEYYVSMAYRPLIKKCEQEHLPAISVYEIPHFMQWGTPDDLAEYNMQSAIFHHLLKRPLCQIVKKGTVIIPMAGLGKRFSEQGYTLTKPLILVSGLPMVIQATRDLPPANQYVFVLREDMPGVEKIVETLKAHFNHPVIEMLPHVSEGQACSALVGLDALIKRNIVPEGPITFGACDNGIIYDHEAFEKMDADVIVWTTRAHPHAIKNPQMYSWVEVESDEPIKIRSISLKKPLENPANDPIVIGTFTFKNASAFQASVERLFNRQAKVNGEYYLDTCINDAIALGLNCQIFDIESYLGWGTPDDLKTFEYWQSCFHQWPSHPYRLEKDSRVNLKEKII